MKRYSILSNQRNFIDKEVINLKVNKMLLILLGFILLVFIAGCSGDEVQDVIKSVKVVEESQHKLDTFQITYDEYKLSLEDIADKRFLANKDENLIFAYKGKMYYGKDLIGMDLVEYQEIGKKIINIFDNQYNKVEISSVYEANDLNLNYVFTKEKYYLEQFDVNKNNEDNYIVYKKYIFMTDKKDGKWKLNGIEKSVNIINVAKSGIDPKQKKFEVFNDKPIEYKHELFR